MKFVPFNIENKKYLSNLYRDGYSKNIKDAKILYTKDIYPCMNNIFLDENIIIKILNWR